MCHFPSRHHCFLLLLGVIVSIFVFSEPVSTVEFTASPTPNSFPPFSLPAPLPPAEPRQNGVLNIVATTPIIADLVRQIGGERVHVDSLLPNNADPHEFEPAPQDLVKLARADAIFVHGLNLDAWSQTLIRNSGTTAPVFVTTTGISTLASHETDLHQGDPHVWFDPTRVIIMAENIATDLTAIDSDGANSYQTRFTAYRAALMKLDQEIAARVALIPVEKRLLVTNHDALNYFADRYGFTIIGTIIPGMDTQAEPSARDISSLIQQIKQHNIKVIFAENTVNPKLANELAAQAGITVVSDLYTDSLGGPESGAETYIGLMQTDTYLIVMALL